MNNNQTLPAVARPLTRTATAAAVAALLSISWVAPASANVVTEWNQLALGCIARGGPATPLDVTLVQVAVHDAVQAIEKRYEPYKSWLPATGSESTAAAAAAAAYRVLSDNRVCPPPATGTDTVQATLNTAFQPYLNGNDPGLVIGYASADAMLAEYRADNGATHTPPTGVGQWQPTPPSNSPMTFVFVATTDPFVMDKPSSFRPGPPPAVTSQRYTKEYNEVKEIGSVQSHPLTPACPAPDATDMARFWGANLNLQWNQALRDVAIDRQLGIGDTARLLALASLAAADAAIGIWDSKVYYNFWRPITAIREGENDGNPNTAGDAGWTPFISSSHFPTTPTPSQTPSYPDYLSGANGLTGAYTTMLQLFFKTDNVLLAIHKVSPATVPICTTPRLYRKISEAAEEVVEARILLGIHFRSADTGARTLGTRSAWNTFTHALQPIDDGNGNNGNHGNGNNGNHGNGNNGNGNGNGNNNGGN